MEKKVAPKKDEKEESEDVLYWILTKREFKISELRDRFKFPPKKLNDFVSRIEKAGLATRSKTVLGDEKVTIRKRSLATRILKRRIQKQLFENEDVVKKYDSPIDHLLHLVTRFKKVPVSDAANYFDKSEETVFSWARILEKRDMIKIQYPMVGGPVLLSPKMEYNPDVRLLVTVVLLIVFVVILLSFYLR
jgi:hypothetical protein